MNKLLYLKVRSGVLSHSFLEEWQENIEGLKTAFSEFNSSLLLGWKKRLITAWFFKKWMKTNVANGQIPSAFQLIL